VTEKAYERLHGFPAKPSQPQSYSLGGGVFCLAWPGICLALILGKLLDSLDWPWVIVLAPIWLPVLIFGILLMGAMWLDKANERLTTNQD
jgi:high-affinity Fe2+/Pb2+ permease